MRFLTLLVSLAPFTGVARGQSAVTACFADPSVTAHYCIDLTKKLMACKDRTCLCTQDMLNHIMWCKEETHNCLLSSQFDAGWEEIHIEWQAKCSTWTTERLTTPSITLSTSLYDDTVCGKANTVCEKVRYEYSACMRTQPILTSCRCDISMVSRESLCLSYQKYCVRESINVTNWAVYQSCPTARSFLEAGTAVPSVSATLTMTSNSSITSAATTRSSLVPTFLGAAPSSNSTNANNGPRKLENNMLGAAPVVFFLLAGILGVVYL